MKQTFTRTLLAVALFVTSLAGYAQKTALSEEFAGSSLPAGWTQTGSVWKVADGYAVFSTFTAGASDRLLTPLTDVSSLSSAPIVAITARQTVRNNTVDYLTLYYRTDATAEWTEAVSWKLPRGGSEVTYSYTCPEAVKTAGKLQLAIQGDNNSAGGIYLNSLVIRGISRCTAAPTALTVEPESLTGVSAFISWNVTSAAVDVKVSTTAITDFSLKADVFDEAAYTYSDLELGADGDNAAALVPSTTYYVYVRGNCGDGDVSEWVETSFTTPCATLASLEEDFDHGVTTMPDCWTTYNIQANGSPTTTTTYQVKPSTTAKKSGTHALYFYNTATYANSYAFLPLVGDISSKQISFSVYSNASTASYNRTIHIALASSQAPASIDGSSVVTLTLPEHKQWYDLAVSFKGYSGQGKYIVIYVADAPSTSQLFVDDVKVDAAPDCAAPFFPVVSGKDATSASLAWISGSVADAAWNVVVSTKTLDETALATVTTATDGVVFAGAANSNPFTVTGLTPATTYYWYVQTGCSGTSTWVQGATFKTAIRIDALPYTQDFGNEEGSFAENTYTQPQEQYVLGVRNSSTDAAVFVTSGTNAGKAGTSTSNTYVSPLLSNAQDHSEGALYTNSLYLKAGSATLRPYIILPAMPDKYDVKNLMITFYVYSATAGKGVEIGVTEEMNNNIPTGQMMKEGGKYQKVGEYLVQTAKTWEKVQMPLGRYTGNGRFITIMTAALASNAVYIDDITVEESPVCWPVVDLAGETLSSNSLRFSWDEQGASTSWEVNVSTSKLTDPATPGDLVAGDVPVLTEKSLTLTDLQPGQTVYCYVRPKGCDVDWQETSATTVYAYTALPYENDFSKYDPDIAMSLTGRPTALDHQPYDLTTGIVKTSSAANIPYLTPYLANNAWDNAPEGVTPNSLVFKVTGSTNTGAWAALPEMAVSGMSVADLAVSFYGYFVTSAMMTGTTNITTLKSGFLKVGVSETPFITSLDQITEVQQVRCLTASTPQRFVVPFTQYEGKGKFIVFYADTVGNNIFVLDNIRVTANTDAQQVTNVEVADITSTGASLSWLENGRASSWTVRLYEGLVTDPATEGYTDINATVKTGFALTGLKSDQLYSLFVRSEQTGQSGEWSLMTRFITACAGPKSIGDGWFDNLNAYDANVYTEKPVLSSCYDFMSSEYSNKTYWPNIVTGNGVSSTWVDDHTLGRVAEGRMLALGASTTYYQHHAVILPEFSEPLNTLQIRFYGKAGASWLASSGTYGWAMVGVYDEATGKLEEVTEVMCAKAQTWQEFTVPFESYTGSGKRIAIFTDNEVFTARGYRGTGKTSLMYIDDISVTKIPTCRRIISVYPSDIDTVSATINWAAAANETAWNIKVFTTEPEDVATATAVFEKTNLTDKFCKLTGLTPGTEYYACVQAACGGEWSQPLAFSTTYSAVGLPYTLDIPQSGTNGLLPDYTFRAGEEVGSNAGVGIYKYAYWNSTSIRHMMIAQSQQTADNYFILPLTVEKNATKLQLSFDLTTYSRTATHYFEVGVVTDPNNMATFAPVRQDTVTGFQATTAATTSEWKKCIYTFEDYKGDDFGNKGAYLAIHYKGAVNTAGSWITSRLYLTNITLSRFTTCITPTDLAVQQTGDVPAISTDTVALSWTDLFPESDFEVRLFTQKPVASNSTAGLSDDDINATPYLKEFQVSKLTELVVKGLEPNTPYYAAVRMNCGAEGVTSWSNLLSFRTHSLKPQPLPYFENFEEITGAGSNTKVLPENWDIVRATTSSYGGVNSGSVYEGTCKMNIPSGDMVITPELDLTNWNGLFVAFYAISVNDYNVHNINIYAVSADGSDKQLVKTVEKGFRGYNVYVPVYADLSSYTGTYNRIGIESTYNTFIDNLLIGNTTATYPVQELAAAPVSDTWAVISFMELNPAQQGWIVEYGAKGFSLGTGTQKQITALTDTLKGLTPNTAYDVYVRPNAGTVVWSRPVTFTTEKPVVNIADYGTDTFAKVDDEWNFIQFAGYERYLWMYRTVEVTDPATYMATVVADQPDNLFFLRAAIAPADYSIYNQNCLHRPNGLFANNVSIISFDSNDKSLGCTTLLNASNAGGYDTVAAKVTLPAAGLYRIYVLYYYNTTGQVIPVQKPAPLRSIGFEPYLCLTPQAVTLNATEPAAASFSWQGGKKSSHQVIVAARGLSNPFALAADAPELAERDSLAVGVTTWKSTKLVPNKDYSFYVRGICEDGEPTEFVELPFTTPCAPAELPLREEFDESFSFSNTCWTARKTAETSLSTEWTHPVNFTDNDVTVTALSVAKNELLVFPPVEAAVSKLRLRARFTLGSGISGSTTATAVIGVMADANNPDSFEQLQTITVKAKDNSNSPIAYVDVNLRLNTYTGDGKVLAIKTANSGWALLIDYIELSELSTYMEPENVTVSNVTKTTALLTWLSAGTENAWNVRLNDADPVRVTDNPYTITGLTPGEDYTVQVQAVYGDTASIWTDPVAFLTRCDVLPTPFNETFASASAGMRMDARCWDLKRSEGTFAQVTAGEAALTAPLVGAGNDIYTWRISAGTADNRFAYINENEHQAWLISPQIAVPANARLTYQLYLYRTNTTSPQTMQGTFNLAVSTDDGATWKALGSPVLPKLVGNGEWNSFSASLDAYAGQNVRIAFVHAATNATATTLRIDNVHINCVQTVEQKALVCENAAWDNEYGFVITADMIEPGKDSLLTRFDMNDASCDIDYAITLSRKAVEKETVEREYCGSSYTYVDAVSENETVITADMLAQGSEFLIQETSADGCAREVTLKLSLAPGCSPTALDESADLGLTLTPNPVRPGQTMQLTVGAAVREAAVYDATGKLVGRISDISAAATTAGITAPAATTADITAPAATGMYMLRIILTDGTRRTARFIVK